MNPMPSAFLLAALLPVAAAAQTSSTPLRPRPEANDAGPASPAPTLVPGRRDAPALSRDDAARRARALGFDRGSDGALWVRGRTYKARFDADGATYIPYLGPDAPRNYPVRFELASVVAGGSQLAMRRASGAERDGERVTIDHGACDEVWDLGRDTVEQSFVFHERFLGALRLELAVETELAASTSDAGFAFAGEHGGVAYGKAWLADADGRRTLLASHLDDGRLVIDVPDGALATARFPIAIDPVVSTISVDITDYDDFDPDIAYDSTTQRYVGVYEEAFSATDHDLYSIAMDANGQWITDGFVEATDGDWRHPHIANLNGADEFLVVATTLHAGDAHRHIRGRMIAAATHAVGSVIDIASHPSVDLDTFDVGGDGYPGSPSFFCVAWRTVATGWVAQYQLVRSDGVLLYSTPPSLSWWFTQSPYGGDVVSLSISNSNGENRWTIAVCLEWYAGGLLGPYGPFFDIGAAQVGWDGSIVTAPWVVDGTFSQDTNPSVSTQLDDGSVMIVFERESASGDHDLYAYVVNGNTSLAQANLTTLDPAMPASLNQARPSVDSDGHQFTLVFEENTITNVFLQSFWFAGNQIGLAEGRTALGTSTSADRNPEITGIRGSGGVARRFFAVWDAFRPILPSGGNCDILGALYDGQLGGPVSGFCFGSVGSIPSCPCASGGATSGCPNSVYPAGANLQRVSGEASVFADSLVFGTSAMTGNACIFIQATGSTPPVQVQDGLLCLGGGILRLATKPVSASQSSYPQPGDPSISVRGAIPTSGATCYYQAFYRNAAAFCTTFTGNYTNALRVVWVP